MSALEIRSVAKTFISGRRRRETAVLRGVCLSVASGTTTAIVGASGCGKTTLLRIIAGFEAADAGSVTIGERTVVDSQLAVAPHKRNVGYVAQDGALFPHLTVGQNISYGLEGRDPERVAELLELVALDAKLAGRRPHQLSGGQQQRVALARALARQPEVMLLDEPFSQLDTGLRAATRRAVARTLAETGMTTVLVTHDQEEALSFADQVAVMRDGAFTQVGDPQVIYAQPADLFTARFMGESVLLDARVHDEVAQCALGRVPVPGAADAADASLMLRPEQIVASAINGVDPGPLPRGTVLDREFLGSDVMLSIALNTGERLTVRQSSAGSPHTGADVVVEVRGAAVAFAQ